MGSLDELLRPDESVELETRKHGGSVAAAFAFLVVAGGALITASRLVTDGLAADLVRWGALGLGAVLVFRFLAAFSRWRSETILVTDHRIIASTGLLRRKVTSLPLRKMTDVGLDRPFKGRIFGHGDVLIDLDDRRVRLVRVPEPKAFYRLLLELIDAATSGPPRPIHADEADTGPLPRVSI